MSEITEAQAREVLEQVTKVKRDEARKKIEAVLEEYGFQLAVANKLEGTTIQNMIYLRPKQ